MINKDKQNSRTPMPAALRRPKQQKEIGVCERRFMFSYIIIIIIIKISIIIDTNSIIVNTVRFAGREFYGRLRSFRYDK